jgi:rubrerythrin
MKKWGVALSAAAILSVPVVTRAQNDTNNDMPSTSGSNNMPSAAGTQMKPGSGMGMSMGSEAGSTDAQKLIRTLSEEKTEINTLAAQQARFRQMGDRQSLRIHRMWGRWIREHKAGGPLLMRLTRANGGNPNSAQILKPPVLGNKATMLHATHMDHVAAVRTSQMRYAATNDRAVKAAMRKRANLARKHIREMMPLMRGMNMSSMSMSHATMDGHNHAAHGATMVAMCPHCNVAMKNGKCPMCGMTAAQMKKS